MRQGACITECGSGSCSVVGVREIMWTGCCVPQLTHIAGVCWTYGGTRHSQQCDMQRPALWQEEITLNSPFRLYQSRDLLKGSVCTRTSQHCLPWLLLTVTTTTTCIHTQFLCHCTCVSHLKQVLYTNFTNTRLQKHTGLYYLLSWHNLNAF